jgi:hypothetical protein
MLSQRFLHQSLSVACTSRGKHFENAELKASPIPIPRSSRLVFEFVMFMMKSMSNMSFA